MTQQQTLTILSNAKRKICLGDPARGTGLEFHAGATELDSALFAQVHDAQDAQGNALRSYLRVGTLTKIDNATLLKPEAVAEMKAESLIRAANTHGSAEDRARLAQRAWVIAANVETRVPLESRHLFESLPVGAVDSSDIDPNDAKHGWRLWLGQYSQRHTDSLLQCMVADQKAAREYSENLATAVAAAGKAR